MRKAVALFLTLSIIVIITALIMQSLKIKEQALGVSEVVGGLVQRDVFLDDLSGILASRSKEIKELIVDGNLTALPPISLENGHIQITPTSLKEHININYFFSQRQRYENNETVVNLFLQKEREYEVVDIGLFAEFLMYILKNNNEASTFNLDKKNVVKGYIYNFAHFEQLLEYYVLQTQDENIKKINWRDFIYFGSKQGDNAQNWLSVKVNYKLGKIIGFIEFLYDLEAKKVLEIVSAT
jgi:hypothetical protein